MIDHSKLQRARNTVQKCQEGTALSRPSETEIKTEYAKKHGLTYSNGKFFKTDGTEETVDPNLLADFGDKLEASNLKKANILSGVSQAIGAAQSMLATSPNVQNQSTETQTANAVYDTAANVVSAVHPLAGTIMKAGGFASDALTAAGIGTDQIDGVDKALDSKFLKLTPVGLVNAIGASKTEDFSIDQEAAEKVGGSYGGLMAEGQAAEEVAGKKVGLFANKGKYNERIRQARQRFKQMASIANEVTQQKDMVNAMGDIASKTYLYETEGGYDPRYMRASAKQGAKLQSTFIPELISGETMIEKIIPISADGGSLFGQKINPTSGQIEDWVPEIVSVGSMKAGGKVEQQLDAPEVESSQKNLIPEGALHKNKHHMENAESLTKKGIPVVDTDHQQQAEIECNEIIFTKEVTEKLEELYKKFYDENAKQSEKDALAIEAGKLLTREIMLNTDDRTGLIDTLKQGGQLPFAE